MYVYDEPRSDAFWKLRKAADHGDTNFRADYDVAVYDDSVLATWIDVRSSSDSQLVPWISSNTNRTVLPVVIE